MRLWFLPLVVAFNFSLCIVLVFFWSTTISKNVKYWPLPTVSEIGGTFPEESFFSFITVVSSVLFLVIVMIRHFILRQNKMHFLLVYFQTFLGSLSAFCLANLSCWSVYLNETVHITFSCTFFIVSVFYFIGWTLSDGFLRCCLGYQKEIPLWLIAFRLTLNIGTFFTCWGVCLPFLGVIDATDVFIHNLESISEYLYILIVFSYILSVSYDFFFIDMKIDLVILGTPTKTTTKNGKKRTKSVQFTLNAYHEIIEHSEDDDYISHEETEEEDEEEEKKNELLKQKEVEQIIKEEGGTTRSRHNSTSSVSPTDYFRQEEYQKQMNYYQNQTFESVVGLIKKEEHDDHDQEEKIFNEV